MIRSLVLAFGRLWPSLSAGKRDTAEPTGTLHATRPPVRIRPATKRDYQQICELYEELDVFHRRARPDLFDRPSAPPRSKRMINELIFGFGTTILVAQDAHSQHLQGFTVLMICDLPESSVCLARRFVEIDKLAVRPEARGGGIGRALLDEAFAWAEHRGIRWLEVAVNDFNTGAITLYESLGFEPVIRRMMRRR